MKWGDSISQERRDVRASMLAITGLFVAGLTSVVVAGEIQHQLMQMVIGFLVGMQ